MTLTLLFPRAKILVDYIFQKVSFQNWLMGGVGWAGTPDATVEETVLLEFVLYRHVFLWVSCFLMLPLLLHAHIICGSK